MLISLNARTATLFLPDHLLVVDGPISHESDTDNRQFARYLRPGIFDGSPGIRKNVT
jgi:hypothetical protein